MNNEEKKAIEILKEFKKTGYLTLQYKYNKDRLGCRVMLENTIETVLNLIEKQAKEIEDLKGNNTAISKSSYMVGVLDERNKWYNKITRKIEELEEERKKYELDWEICDDIEAEIAFLKELIRKEE